MWCLLYTHTLLLMQLSQLLNKCLQLKNYFIKTLCIRSEEKGLHTFFLIIIILLYSQSLERRT